MMNALPQKTYFGRMQLYFREMFPIPGHAAVAFLNAIGINGFVETLLSDHTASWVALLIATWNILAGYMILRLMDEIKDKDIDKELFPERPVPSGRVLESDILISLYVVIFLYFLANSGSLPSFLLASVVVGYATLMFKRFFLPELLKSSLPITLLTHTPIVPLMLFQVVVCITELMGRNWLDLQSTLVLLYLLMIWFSILAWELSRKIRAADEETAYVTYSQILGRPGAIAATLSVQTVSFMIGLFFYFHFALDWPYLFIMALGYCLSFAGHLRFLYQPNSSTSKLKPYTYGFITAILLAQVYGFNVWN
jgi:heme O synthase-like polyprenyltransferase